MSTHCCTRACTMGNGCVYDPEPLTEVEQLTAELDQTRERLAACEAARDAAIIRAENAEFERDEARGERDALKAVRGAGCACGDNDACAFVLRAEKAEAEAAGLWADGETADVPEGYGVCWDSRVPGSRAVAYAHAARHFRKIANGCDREAAALTPVAADGAGK